MNRINFLMLCLVTTFGFAQTRLNKTSQTIDVSKDVVVDLNTNYVEIEVDTWSKDEVSVEAYLESETLSKEDLEKALEAWNLKVDGSSDYVKISSEGAHSLGLFAEPSYDIVLKDLEFALADLPEMPEMPEMPEIPNMEAFPEMPEMPEMPEFPELPELPEGVSTIQFDYDRYQKLGEKYLEEWSKRYEKEGGKELQKRMEEWARKFADSDYQKKMEAWGDEYAKRFEGQWAKDMEKWGEEFGEKYAEDMEKWGEEFGKKFGKEWAAKMEAWGERFGRQMERQTQLNERMVERRARQTERQLKRKAELEKMSEKRRVELQKRRAELEKRRAQMVEKRHKLKNREANFYRNSGLGSDSKVKKVIKISIPKKAKLKLNVRHGELKLASVLHNAQGNIAHAFVVAEHIDGSDTSINVSYSPVIINTWGLGTLKLNFVDKAQIKSARNLVLNSKSSNVLIDTIADTAIIDGSFGDLTIGDLQESFKNLNLVLENTDALIDLPDQLGYNLYFKGDRSKFNNSPTSQKTIRKDGDGQSSSRSIVVNAKFSNVIMD